jgi:hypothetical protein
MLPMLEVMKILNKLVQNIECPICDFAATMKFTQVNIYNLYVDP